MKPLELTVYDTDPSDPDCVVINGYWEYRPHSTDKRFTDAELAAEYHSAWASMLDVPEDERYPHERPRIETLHRFATMPHYDEASL